MKVLFLLLSLIFVASCAEPETKFNLDFLQPDALTDGKNAENVELNQDIKETLPSDLEPGDAASYEEEEKVESDMSGHDTEGTKDFSETSVTNDTTGDIEEVEENKEEVFMPPEGYCNSAKPCEDENKVCMLLPDSDFGVCILECNLDNGNNDCPPGNECIVVNSGSSTGACFKIADYGEKCDAKEGILCDAGKMTYCLSKDATPLTGTCTAFCDPSSPSCSYFQTCQKITGENSFACFEAPLLPECENGSCPEGFSCVNGRCYRVCLNDSSCEKNEKCIFYESVKVCSKVAPFNGKCSIARGIFCDTGFVCKGEKDGEFGICTKECEKDSDCPSQAFCLDNNCFFPDVYFEKHEMCNEEYPCEQGFDCEKFAPGEAGVCLKKCDTNADCPSSTVCKDSVCKFESKKFYACDKTKGIFCPQNLKCFKKEGETTGICVNSCNSDADCSEEDEKCDPEFGVCLKVSKFGEKCNENQGIYCENGTVCFSLNSMDDGICTKECENIGDKCENPDENSSLNPMCIYIKNGKKYCGFMCGALGGECPSFMECENSTGLCEIK